ILRAYALAALPALAAAVGAITLIEIAYRRSTQPEAGAVMRLFWVSMDTARPWPWLGAAVLLVAGAILLRRSLRHVDEAWGVASARSHG
ncbi:MAG TPA: hypothetical protein VFP36_06055, partial [Usitatibacter sp.]|nr:hypothetical protein [Usitatibacter sp.]